MPNDKKFGVKVVVSAVDNASAQFKEISKKLANSDFAKLNNSLRFASSASGLKAFSKSVGNFGGAVSNAAGEFTGLLTKIGAIAGLGGGGLFLLAKNFSEFAQNVEHGASRLGISEGEFQKFSIAAQLGSVNTEVFSKSMDKFSRSLGEAAIRGSNVGKIFSFLKIDPKNFKSFGKALPQVALALSKMGNANLRNALGAKLFGRQFGEILPLIKDFKNLTDEAGGFIISDEDLKKGKELNNTFDRFVVTFDLIKTLAGAELAEGFSQVLKDFQKFLKENKAEIRAFFKAIGKELPDAFRKLAGAINLVVGFFFNYNKKTGEMTVNTGRMQAALLVIGAILAGPFLASLVIVFGAFASMVTSFLTFATIILESTVFEVLIASLGDIAFLLIGGLLTPWGLIAAAAVGAGLLIYKYWAPIRDLLKEIYGFEEKIKAKWSGVFSKENFQAAFGTAPTATPIGNFLQNQSSSVQTNNATASLQVSFSGMPGGSKVSQTSSGWESLLVDRGFLGSGL